MIEEIKTAVYTLVDDIVNTKWLFLSIAMLCRGREGYTSKQVSSYIWALG